MLAKLVEIRHLKDKLFIEIMNYDRLFFMFSEYQFTTNHILRY